jgi:ribosome-associated protein
MEDLDLVRLINHTIAEKKGINALALDVHDISTMCDYVVIAEGFVDKHVVAMASAILSAARQEKVECLASQGMNFGDWVVLDFGYVVVHLMTPAYREKYDIEELYRAAKLLPLTA